MSPGAAAAAAARSGADAHAVEVAIGRLRSALGARELIVTVVKRGYRPRRRLTLRIGRMPLKSQRELLLACSIGGHGRLRRRRRLPRSGRLLRVLHERQHDADGGRDHDLAHRGCGQSAQAHRTVFVGTVAGGLLAHYRDGRVSVLVGTSTLVGIAAVASTQPWLPVPAVLIAATVAMGMLNATFVHDGRSRCP